jgi:hypothetical protein
MEGVMGDLYETDFITWTEQQARVLREAAASRSNLALDWPNLIEEVEALGREHYRAVASQIRRIVAHLLKLEFSPATEPRAGWRTTVRNARAEIEGVLESDPGLKPRLADMIRKEAPRATKLAAEIMSDHGEDASGIMARLRAGAIYAPTQILDDWFPGDLAA